jgi:pre-rRNA-processing protein TSR4
MDPYDSDSSVDGDFTDTGVLLGYAAEDVIEDVISHLGGWPVCSTTAEDHSIISSN